MHYGSKAEDGKSYTEKEYDFAREQGIPVLAFTYDENARQKLPEIEKDPKNHNELMAFIQKLKSNRIVKIWSDEGRLISDIERAINKQTHSNPQIGWVRGDAVMSSKAMNELENLRSENAEMKAKLAESNEDLKKYLEVIIEFTLSGLIQDENGSTVRKDIKIDINLSNAFMKIGEILHSEPTEQDVIDRLFKYYKFKINKINPDFNLDERSIKLNNYLNRFSAAKLITTSNKQTSYQRRQPTSGRGIGNYETIYQQSTTWKFTDRGRDYYYAQSVALLPSKEESA